MVGATAAFLTTADLASRPDFQLGQVVVSPSRRSIRGPGGDALVEPRVMQVLVVLAESVGNVVTRDILFQRCWGSPSVGDDSLNRAIAGARRIASGVAQNSFTIENIPRTGYRLTQSGMAEDMPEPDAKSLRRGVDRRWVVAGGLAFGGLGALAVWKGRSVPPDPVGRLIEESQTAMRAGTSASERQSIALLERAVKLAPENADAWGLLALARARADEHGGPDLKDSPAAQVELTARRALRLAPGNADAQAALAVVIPYYGDWLAAERRFDSVLSKYPNHLFTKDSRSFLLGAVGRMQESARDRSKFSANALFDANLQFRHIYALWFLGRIGEADRVASRAAQMWPGHPGIWFGRLWLLTGTGRLDRGLMQIDDEATRPRLPPAMIQTLRGAVQAAQSGRSIDIDAATRSVMAGAKRSVAAVVNAMMLLNLMGALDAAFDLARAYYLEQGPFIAAMERGLNQPYVQDQRRRKTNMLFTPTAAAMQRDSRFLPLMDAMGLSEYWDRRGILPDFMASARS